MYFERAEDIRSNIPNIHRIVEIKLPLWALDEDDNPIPAEVILGDYAPDGEFVPVDSDEDRHRTEDVSSVLMFDQTSERYQRIESEFDDRGLLITRVRFIEGQLSQRERFEYDKDSRLILRVNEDVFDENVEQEECSYDWKNRISRRVHTYADGSQLVTTYTWVGNVEEVISRSDDGIESHEINTYNSKDQCVECRVIDPSTEHEEVTYTEYDEKGHLIREGLVDDHGNRQPYLAYLYDSEGNEEAYEAYDARGEVELRRESYYEDGLLVEQRTTVRDGVSSTTYEYHENRKLRRSIEHAIGSMTEEVHDYDAAGNAVFNAIRVMSEGQGRRSIFAKAASTWYEYECHPTVA